MASIILADKTCKKCDLTKSISEFYRNSNLSAGYSNTCKECVKTANRNRTLTPDQRAHKNTQSRIYKQTEKGRQLAANYRERNKEKLNKRTREWCRKTYGFQPRKPAMSGEEKRKATRYYGLRHKYKIEKEDFEKLLEKQNGMCAICKTENNNLVVDHCHQTGKIRGLLCRNHNSAIGLLNDSPDLVRQALEYLLANK